MAISANKLEAFAFPGEKLVKSNKGSVKEPEKEVVFDDKFLNLLSVFEQNAEELGTLADEVLPEFLLKAKTIDDLDPDDAETIQTSFSELADPIKSLIRANIDATNAIRVAEHLEDEALIDSAAPFAAWLLLVSDL